MPGDKRRGGRHGVFRSLFMLLCFAGILLLTSAERESQREETSARVLQAIESRRAMRGRKTTLDAKKKSKVTGTMSQKTSNRIERGSKKIMENALQMRKVDNVAQKVKKSANSEGSSDSSDSKSNGSGDKSNSIDSGAEDEIKDKSSISVSSAEKSISMDTAISTSANKDSEVIVPLAVVIPEDYNPQMLPKPPKGPVEVKLRILLEQIYGVKQLDHTITVGIRTFCLWKDRRLSYNGTNLGHGMNYFQVNPDNIWTPRVEILNVIGTDQTYQSAQVYPDGSVFLTTRMMSIVTVKFAAQWFPFDRQNFIFEYGELGYSKDLVYLNTTSTDWTPAFTVEKGDVMNELAGVVKRAERGEAQATTREDTVSSADLEEKFREPVEVLQQGNFILGVDVLETASEGDAYWIVDSFTGWQGLRFGEGAHYYYVGVSTLLEMHRGREHFILVYILPLVFIITVSQANWYFDVRDLDPRLTIASGLLLCMVAFQYTIEQELPKVSYPLWINYYMVGCYCMIVFQCALMVFAMRLAGRRVASNGRWSRKTADSWVDVGYPGPSEKDTSVPKCVREQWEREKVAEKFNVVCSIAYPSVFLVFNIVMFALVLVYT